MIFLLIFVSVFLTFLSGLFICNTATFIDNILDNLIDSDSDILWNIQFIFSMSIPITILLSTIYYSKDFISYIVCTYINQ